MIVSRILTLTCLLLLLGTSACSPDSASSPVSTATTDSQPASPLTISFDPNPVKGENGHWYFYAVTEETAGVGITLYSVTIQTYDDNGPVGEPHAYGDAEWFDQWLPDGYLAPGAKARLGAGLPVQDLKYEVFTYTGVDDNGNSIVVTGRVDLEP